MAVPLALFLVARSPYFAPESSGGALARAALLLPLSLSWAIAVELDIKSLASVLALLIVPATVAVVAGSASARTLTAPTALVAMTLPVWDYATPFLQRLTVAVAERALAFGPEIQFDRQFVRMPDGILEIAEGCSGLAYLLAAVAMAIGIATFRRLSILITFKLITLAAVVAVISNWFRVCALIVAAQHLGTKHPLLLDHAVLGTAVFALFVIPSLICFLRSVDPGSNSSLVSDAYRIFHGASLSPQGSRALLVGVTALAAGPLCLAAIPETPAPPLVAHCLQMPALSSWPGSVGSSSILQPTFHGAMAETRAAYESGGTVVSVYLAAYSSQGDGGELVSASNSITGPSWRLRPDSGWLRPGGTREATSVDGRRALVDVRYVVGSIATSSPVIAKSAEFVARLRGEPVRAVIHAAALCDDDCESAERALNDFLSAADRPMRAAIEHAYECTRFNAPGPDADLEATGTLQFAARVAQMTAAIGALGSKATNGAPFMRGAHLVGAEYTNKPELYW